MTECLKKIDAFVWGPAMLVFMLGTGIFLLIRMRFLPLRQLGYALRCVCGTEEKTAHHKGKQRSGKQKRKRTDCRNNKKRGEKAADCRSKKRQERRTEQGGVSPLSSLTTELAATIGTGNIVGVATAMTLGGPGALIWMLLAAFAGLSTKFAESMLSVKYRVRNADGSYSGGPMYTLCRAFPNRRLGSALGKAFALFAVFASFGMGNMTQANSVSASLHETFGIGTAKSGLVLTILVILAVIGGIRMISKLTLYMVPCMALFYIIGALCVIVLHIGNLPHGIAEMVQMAFSGEAVAGGMGGTIVASMQDAMRLGISRGVFSNEAGLGAGGITAAAAETDSPVRQGYISMTGVFFDTIVICTLTGLTLSASGVLGMRDETGRMLDGAALTIAAFSTVFGEFGGCFVSIGICLFAFATMIAWEYQGESAFVFLVRGRDLRICYRFLYGLVTFAGSVCVLETVWEFSDIMNALMAVPNLVCVLALSGVVCRDMRTYVQKNKK